MDYDLYDVLAQTRWHGGHACWAIREAGEELDGIIDRIRRRDNHRLYDLIEDRQRARAAAHARRQL